MHPYGNRVFGLAIVWLVGLLYISPSSAQSAVSKPADIVSPTGPNSTVSDGTGTAPYANQQVNKGDYILGQGDRLSIQVFGANDLPTTPVDVSAEGDIVAPLVGRVHAGGMSVRGLESALTENYAKFYKNPEVTVTVAEYRSEPVTVVGSVNTPGVVQLRRPTRLMEVLSQAGGLRQDAGNSAFVTSNRPANNSSGQTNDQEFTTQEIDLRKIIEGEDPNLNILVRPNDLITIPKAKMVYVIGDVGRPGGYVLDEHSNALSVLQALALAGGVNKTAKAGQSRILRRGNSGSERTESKINLSKILSDKAPDVELHADDILFVPNSVAKNAGARALEAAIDIGTGVAIWR